MDNNRLRIVVAMSGGVDSSVAAAILAKNGHDVIGISMQVWDYRQNGGSKSRATCCAPNDFADARQVATIVNIPYFVFDLEEVFNREVIQKFVDYYNSGLTPNPCVDCNNKVKFLELRRRAKLIGYPIVATGHYARILQDNSGFHLYRSSDLDKDQSYFLYGLTQDDLANTIFPIGDMTKSSVRQLATELKLPIATKAESQDICFVSGTASEFVEKIGRKKSIKGQVVYNASGSVLGTHNGVHNFTVGQRRGLGIGGFKEPLYVTAIDAESGKVTVGLRSELERESFIVNNINGVNFEFSKWLTCQVYSPITLKNVEDNSIQALVQVRHRHQPVRVRLTKIYNDNSQSSSVACKFLDNSTPIAPGQAAVFYQESAFGQEVLGGGRISQSPL